MFFSITGEVMFDISFVCLHCTGYVCACKCAEWYAYYLSVSSSGVFRVCWKLCYSVTVWFWCRSGSRSRFCTLYDTKKNIYGVLCSWTCGHCMLSGFVQFVSIMLKLWSTFIFTRWQFEPSVSESFWGHGKWSVAFSFVVSLMPLE